MTQCKRCHSYAINPSQHGRDGTRLDLCDVCFWRETAETRAARIKRLEEAARAAYLDSIASDHPWTEPEIRNMHALRDALEDNK